MLDAITRNWWVVLFRGLFALLIGVFAFSRPDVTVLSMVLVWGVFAEADAIVTLVLAATGHGSFRSRLALTAAGIVGLIAGFTAWVWPQVGVAVLLWIVAVWAIVRGLLQIIAAIELRLEVEGEWLMLVGGVLSMIFGVVVIARPLAGVVAIAFLIGLYAAAAGLLEIALALSMRRIRHELGHRTGPRHSTA